MRPGITPAAAAGAGCGLILLAVALGFGRVDLAVTGVALLCAVALGYAATAAAADPEVTVDVLPGEPGTRSTAIGVRAAVRAPGADLVLLSAVELGARTRAVAVPGHGQATFDLDTVHTGDQELLRLRAVAIRADGTWTDTYPGRTRAVIEPRARALPFLPLSRVPTGLTGAHDAPRPGDGGEFRDIHPFASGDRPARIDWKATARLARRPGDLFVRRTQATSDIDLALVLDDGDDITGMVGDWVRGDRSRQAPTSMDVAREAAWSLACAYLGTADQVSFQVLSRAGSAVPRGSGARHRERLRAAICAVTPQQRLSRSRTPLVPRGALVVLLSTFLDDETVRLIGLWRAAGHRVLAVDTLPQLRSERLTAPELVASRIVLGARSDRLAELRAVGADVLQWDTDPGLRTAALRSMTRMRRRR
ncbi:hypothetical protein GCM10022240_22240 [Microbacterium kribbense]|uniref:DUF58 domain-containing protein n=1 Tax=Microbacterium kribbense TaxID=433645 RepID=A0ABP7GMJ8_9MICO